MTVIMSDAQLQRSARLAGALYLLQMAVAIFGEMFVRGRLVTRDAAVSAANIASSERLFRVSILTDVLVYLTVVILAWLFFRILRRVNHDLALLALILRVVENAILATSTIFAMLALRLSLGQTYVAGIGSATREGLGRLFLSAMGANMNTAFIFLGTGSAIFAYLFLRSGFVPRWIAWWGIVASSLLATGSMTGMVFPEFSASAGMLYMIPMFFYEVGLGMLLLTKGLRLSKPAVQSGV